jgi:hypothetical protein
MSESPSPQAHVGAPSSGPLPLDNGERAVGKLRREFTTFYFFSSPLTEPLTGAVGDNSNSHLKRDSLVIQPDRKTKGNSPQFERFAYPLTFHPEHYFNPDAIPLPGTSARHRREAAIHHLLELDRPGGEGVSFTDFRSLIFRCGSCEKFMTRRAHPYHRCKDLQGAEPVIDLTQD